MVLVCSITSPRNATSITSSPDCQFTPVAHCTHKLHYICICKLGNCGLKLGLSQEAPYGSYSPQRNFLLLQDAAHRLLLNQVVLSPLRKHHPTSAYKLLPLMANQANCIFHYLTGIIHISLYPISVASSPSGSLLKTSCLLASVSHSFESPSREALLPKKV